jgi:hypothetical protein
MIPITEAIEVSEESDDPPDKSADSDYEPSSTTTRKGRSAKIGSKSKGFMESVWL